MSLQPPIYRQAALDKYKSPQPLDEIPQLIPLRSWIAFAALVCLVSAAVLWGFFGTLTTQIETHGVAQADRLIVPLVEAQAVEVQPGMAVRALCAEMQIAGTVTAVTYDAARAGFEAVVALDAQSRSPFLSPSPCSVTLITRQERPIQRVFPGL
jgi:hypothetical protein